MHGHFIVEREMPYQNRLVRCPKCNGYFISAVDLERNDLTHCICPVCGDNTIYVFPSETLRLLERAPCQ